MLLQNYNYQPSPGFAQINPNNKIPINYLNPQSQLVVQPQILLQPNQINTTNDDILKEFKTMQMEQKLEELKAKNDEMKFKILKDQIIGLKESQKEKHNQELELHRLNLQLNMLKNNQNQNQNQNVLIFGGPQNIKINNLDQLQLQPKQKPNLQMIHKKPIVIVPSAGRPAGYRFKK